MSGFRGNTPVASLIRNVATGPPRQATGPPRLGAGVGDGILRGFVVSWKSQRFKKLNVQK